MAYHVRSLCSRHRELQIGILLPVTEEQGELGQKPVVCASDSCNGLRVGVAIDSTLQRLCGANEFLPCLEVVGIVGL